MLTKQNALLAAGAAILVALAGDRAASAADGNWVLRQSGDLLPGDAIAGGHDTNGQTLYFCRVYQPGGAYQPGKVNQNLGSCRYGYGGHEVSAPLYEVMVPHWEWTSGGQLTGNPFLGGFDSDYALLYPCRAFYQGGLQPGKLKQGAGCYIGYGGNEYLLNDYQVLQADLPMMHGDAGRVPDIDNIPIIAGFEADQTTYLSLCAAYLYNDDGTFNSSQPGKYLAADGMCHSSYAGVEVSTGSFTMVLPQTRAIAEANVPIFFNFAVGQDTNGQPLYACTGSLDVDNRLSLQLGKYRRDFEFCHVGYGGLEQNAGDSRLLDGPPR